MIWASVKRLFRIRLLLQKVEQTLHNNAGDFGGQVIDSADLQCVLVDPYVYLAPYPALRIAMLAGVPLSFTLGLDAGAVDEEVQRAGTTAIREAHVQRSLTAAKGAEIGRCPIKPDQPAGFP